MGSTKKRLRPPFARNIMARRKALKWNAHKLAEMAGIPYPTLRDIEAGINYGREETKDAIAKALGASVSDLYKDDSAKGIPDLTAAAAFLSSFQSLSPDLQKIVLAIVHGDIDYASDLTPEFAKKFEPLLEALG